MRRINIMKAKAIFFRKIGWRIAFALPLLYCGIKPVYSEDAQQRALVNPGLVNAFYIARAGNCLWFTPDSSALDLRRELIWILEKSITKGLNKEDYHYEYLKKHLAEEHVPFETLMSYEKTYTDAAVSYMKDIFQGRISGTMISNDELSQKSEAADNRYILDLLNRSKNSRELRDNMEALEPKTLGYSQLINTLSLTDTSIDKERLKQLIRALDYYRWIYHFHFEKCIVVNIASGMLHYYEKDSMILEMKVVTGKPSTPTPRFATYCNQVILYPYWNVPQSIALNEILPLCKKGAGVLDFMNMQVIDAKGNIIDHKALNWKGFSKKNFPYRFRQSTGCDNALGVIKLNLTSPYSVYLHDTNMKFAFASTKRYFSHGCIRIEKPVELIEYLLKGDFDEAFLAACVRGQKPVVKPVHDPVPVFVIYSTADIQTGTLTYHDDVYDLN
ncbi:MAG: L,D-transpeptidase family protein [Taibaiella sp.]